MTSARHSYYGYRFPPEIVSHAVACKLTVPVKTLGRAAACARRTQRPFAHDPRRDRQQRVTVPRFPSTMTSSPSRSVADAFAVATTAGKPNSRATIAVCDSVLP